MRRKIYLILFAIPFFTVSCFTSYHPVFVHGANDQLQLVGAPEVHVDVPRNYFLLFGGTNKRPMMAEAREKLSIKYAGFVPFKFINLSVDEAKSTYFFLYSQHTLTISANMLFDKPESLLGARDAIQQLNDYGFVKGDRVAFRSVVAKSDLNVIINSQGVINSFQNKLADVKVDETRASDVNLKDFDGNVKAEDLRPLPKNLVDYKENDEVIFVPRGYLGSPFSGRVKSFYNNYVVAIELSKSDKNRWIELGGIIETDGTIYVPTFRLFKSTNANI